MPRHSENLHKPPPRFKIGDHVVDFRGNRATIEEIEVQPDPRKSHKVKVKWDKKPHLDDKVMYYEFVFRPSAE